MSKVVDGSPQASFPQAVTKDGVVLVTDNTPVQQLCSHRNNSLALFALAGILAVSAYLRYVNLATNPGWDGDEGYNINIAWNLAQGKLQMFATTFAFVQHPPLFYVFLVPIFKIFGPTILALRLLTSTFGVLTTFVLYLTGRGFGGQKAGLFAAGVFAIYPVAVIHNRWGYSYNQLMFLVALCIHFTTKYFLDEPGVRKTRWLFAAALSAGLGMVTDQVGVFLIIGTILVALVVDRRKAAPIAITALLFPVLYVVTMLLLTPSEFLYDWQHNIGRVNEGNAAISSLVLGINYEQFLAFDYWLPLGLMGIFMIPHRRVRMAIVLFSVIGLILILKIRNPNPFFRTAIPLLPFISIGFAVLLIKATEYLFNWGNEILIDAIGRRWQRLRPAAVMLVIFALIYMPITVTLLMDVVGVQTKLKSKADAFVVNSADDALAVAQFINGNTTSEDFIIASSHISWMFTSQTADLLQAVVKEGKGTAFYPSDLPASRFAYDPRYNLAKYVVLDDFSRLWTQEMPEERVIVEEVTTNWTVVFRSGEYTVFRNPSWR